MTKFGDILGRIVRPVAAACTAMALAASVVAQPAAAANADSSGYVFMVLGDSLAVGVGATSPQQGVSYLLYQDYLQHHPGAQYVNLARGGTGVADVNAVLSGINTVNGAIYVNIGGNDVTNINEDPNTFAQNVAFMLNKLASFRVPVHIDGVPRVADTPRMKRSLSPIELFFLDLRTQQFNTALASAVKSAGNQFEFFDFYDFVTQNITTADFSIDGYHPNDTGYALITRGIIAASRCNEAQGCTTGGAVKPNTAAPSIARDIF